jgi:hypothetical protein
MSIIIKKSPEFKEWGKLVVTSETNHLSAEDYINRMRAIINLVQSQEEQDRDSTYHALEILNDMLPDYEQARNMFNTPH